MKNKIRKTISYLFLLIGLLLLSTVFIYLFLYFRNSYKSANELNDLKKMVVIQEKDIHDDTVKDEETNKRQKPDFSKLLEENSDFVGWITIEGTNIDYPVMQTPGNEEYYIRRNFQKKYDASGVPFCNSAADLEKPSDNIIIYGHHMRAGTMFHNLSLFKDEEFYQDHKTFIFDTIYRMGTYEIIAVCRTDINEGAFKYWEVVDCKEDEFNEYINWLAKKSIYKIDGINDVEYGDKLVTLSTCAYHVTNGRMIVVGKLIETDDIDLLNK